MNVIPFLSSLSAFISILRTCNNITIYSYVNHMLITIIQHTKHKDKFIYKINIMHLKRK